MGETAGNIATLMFSMCLTFNGVFQPPFALPGFWIFMYRVSPLTYLLSAYASASGGEIYNPNATSDCEFCTARVADQFLSSVAISYTTRWRDYGIGFAFIFFNIAAAVLLYYFFRVRKSSGKGVGEKLSRCWGCLGRILRRRMWGVRRRRRRRIRRRGRTWHDVLTLITEGGGLRGGCAWCLFGFSFWKTRKSRRQVYIVIHLVMLIIIQK